MLTEFHIELPIPEHLMSEEVEYEQSKGQENEVSIPVLCECKVYEENGITYSDVENFDIADDCPKALWAIWDYWMEKNPKKIQQLIERY